MKGQSEGQHAKEVEIIVGEYLDTQERASLSVVGQVDEREHGAHDVLALVIMEGEAIRIHLYSARPS